MSPAHRRTRAAAAGLGLLLASCGGGGGNPVAPPTPPVEVFSLAVELYYDENANGQLDGDELARVPNATVSAAGRSARTEMLTGKATLNGLRRGQATVTVTGLPPFYVAPQAVTVEVPAEGVLALPATLPIGANYPNRYLAFGDSITDGDGSSNGEGYPPMLEDRLKAHFGAGEVLVDAVSGSYTDEGAARIGRALNRNRPAFTLILYGTNDWYPCEDAASCYTIPALASMVQNVKAAGGLPVLATIIPVNAGYDARVPPRRNEWVADMNKLIRDLARAEGALLVDLEPAFYKAAGSDLSQLFDDHVHPNDKGYIVMADEFYRTLAAPVESSGSSASSWEMPVEAPLALDPPLALGPPRLLEGGPRPLPKQLAPRPRLREE